MALHSYGRSGQMRALLLLIPTMQDVQYRHLYNATTCAVRLQARHTPPYNAARLCNPATRSPSPRDLIAQQLAITNMP